MLTNKLNMLVITMFLDEDPTLDCSIRGAIRLAIRKIEQDILSGITIIQHSYDTRCDPNRGVNIMLYVLQPASPQPDITTAVVIGEQCR